MFFFQFYRFALPVFLLFSICFFSFIFTLFFPALYNNLCTKTTLNVVTLVSHSQETGDKKTACTHCGVIMHTQQPITLQIFYFLCYKVKFCMLSININNKFSLTENQGVFKEFLKIVNFKGISSALENEI